MPNAEAHHPCLLQGTPAAGAGQATRGKAQSPGHPAMTSYVCGCCPHAQISRVLWKTACFTFPLAESIIIRADCSTRRMPGSVTAQVSGPASSVTISHGCQVSKRGAAVLLAYQLMTPHGVMAKACAHMQAWGPKQAHPGCWGQQWCAPRAHRPGCRRWAGAGPAGHPAAPAAGSRTSARQHPAASAWLEPR